MVGKNTVSVKVRTGSSWNGWITTLTVLELEPEAVGMVG